MEIFHNLIFGFGVALSWQNLLYCLIGVSVGTLVVVGLARNQTPIDWILSAFAVPVSRIARVRRGWYDHGAPMLDPRESWGEVRRAAKAALPGSRYRRRLYWRYTLVWNRPL